MTELVGRAYRVYLDRMGRRPAPMDDDYARKIEAGQVVVADSGGRLAGLIVLVARPDHLLVENLAVDPDLQGKGVGGTLLAHAEDQARKRHLPELRLYTNAAMTENLIMYPRRGYTETARRTEDGFDRVFFAKRL